MFSRRKKEETDGLKRSGFVERQMPNTGCKFKHLVLVRSERFICHLDHVYFFTCIVGFTQV